MKYGRTYNFSAGPAMMPEEVLEEIAAEMMNYRGSGMCVMEMSHRSKVFQQIRDEAEADLRQLMGIPDNYKVLFVQGGGTVQFAMVPMNLMKNGVACYVETGNWSKKAIKEPPPRTRTSPTSPTAPIWTSPTTQITSISARTRPSTAPPISICPTPRARSWCRISPPCSSPVPAMSPSTA